MLLIQQIQNLINEATVQEKKPDRLNLNEIVEGLELAGHKIPERTVRRQLHGFSIKKGCDGFYSAADAALLVCWNSRRSLYASYSEFFQCEGKRFYELANRRLCVS